MNFTFGSLFSGIGGIDLGLEQAGMQCKWQVEKDAFCQKVLAKHWPNVVRFRDVRECGRDTLIGVDLIAGGFPCQPHSLAGERKASEDERDLWPEFYRIIRELKPRWVLGENVLGLLSSENGAFFGGILRDMAQAGYDAEWRVLSAAEFGAPHLRERVFFVAYPACDARELQQSQREDIRNEFAIDGASWATELAHASRSGRQELNATTITGASEHFAWCKIAPGKTETVENTTGRREWQYQATRGESRAQPIAFQPGSGTAKSLLGGMFDGLSAWMDRYQWPAGPGEQQHNWEPPRVISERLPCRTVRLKALGNTVLPQLAEAIGYCILESEVPA